MRNNGFKVIRQVSSNHSITGKVEVFSNGSFGSRLTVLCNPSLVVRMGSFNHRVYSAAVMDISSFDEFAKKTLSVDIVCISSFIFGEPDNDIDREAWFDLVSEGTERLRGILDKSQFSYVEVEGEYRKGDDQIVEISFIVANVRSGCYPEAFLDFFVDLSKNHGQESILIKPAKDMVYRGKLLAREIAYWYFCDTGRMERKGWLRKKTYEEWVASSSRKVFSGSRFRISGIDFTSITNSRIGHILREDTVKRGESIKSS